MLTAQAKEQRICSRAHIRRQDVHSVGDDEGGGPVRPGRIRSKFQARFELITGRGERPGELE